jgi:tetratricopeptide (TPR) repeat protein
MDGKPVPRIIDFGLAKTAAPPADGATLFTQVGAFVGTPGYTSPEQADPSGQGVDTRTDVYSLGVVLYVMLTGVEPFDDGTGRKRPLLERLRQLREADPPSPSEKLNSDRKTLISSADSRGIAPNQLRSILHGDLDWIGMKALEKDRERRYGTPMELAADIERHLHGRPVHAAPPSFTYRAGKFIRRNRLALGSAAVIVLVLVAASIISIRQSIRASREAAVAQAVSDFLQHDLLAQAGASGQSGPGTKPDPDLKVRTALDRAAQRINGKFAGQPAIEVAIRTTMGRTYEDLGLYPQAQEQLKKAAEDGRRTLGMDDDLTLIALHDLGSLLLEQGKYKEAETIDAEVLSARRRVSGPKDPKTLACMNDLATVYRDEGKYAQAEALHLQALEIFKRILGPEDPATLSSMSNLALIYSDEGRLAEAEKLDLQTLEIRKRVLGPEHPYTLTSMSNLGIVYSGEGKFAEAEKLDAEILDIRKRVLGPEHPYTLNSMNNLAEDYSDQGEYAQAEALDAQALEIRKRVQGPEHPATLEAMATLARDFYKQGKYAQAEPLFDELLKIQRRILGLESPDAAATIYSMGCMEARRGDKDKAIAQLRQSIDHGLAPYLDLGMQKDSDLVSLYGDPRFIGLFAHARQVAAAKTARTQAPH